MAASSADTSHVEETLSAMRYQPRLEGATIFKVPHTIRSAQPEAYEPKFVGIGLFHHSLNLPVGHRIIAAESHKLQYFLDLRMRNQSRTWEDYVNAIKGEPLAFDCYSETPPTTVSREDLQARMVLDVCFILELFLKAADKGRNLQGDPIYGTPWFIQQIAYDLLLMENQLPFIVLENVYRVFRGPRPFPTFSHKQELIDLALGFFNMWFTKKDSSSAGGMQTNKTNPAGSSRVDVSLLGTGHEDRVVGKAKILNEPLGDIIEGGNQEQQPQQYAAVRANTKVLHLLHLVYQNFFNFDPPKDDKKSNVYLCFPLYRYKNAATDEEENLPNNQKVTIPTVTHLRDAGVRLCKAKRANHLAVKFMNGRLEIPFFLLEESSDSVIRNLIAFEQCCRNSIYQHNYSLSLYAYFLSRLVNSENDVQMMRESGVLEHFLGSDEEAAKFFNKLCQGIVIDFRRTYLGEVCEQLNQYYQFRPHMWRANLMRDYFSNPWSILSLVAALLLLLLTLLQTLYSVLSYTKSG